MKTKTYNVHQEVIKASITNLLSKGLKITKTSISKNIDEALYRMITFGKIDLTLFPEQVDVDYVKVETIYNQLYK